MDIISVRFLKKLNKINSCLPSKAGCVMLHDLKKT